ncbi:MAG: aquaporin Z [Candidatus Azotimanducaceae bacterium]|jgi:aquaporin Z
MKNALIAEFIGTFFLYLIIGMCITPPASASIVTPLAIGVGLAALVYSCGHLSKAHFNPTTTIAYATAGTHKIESFLPYMLVIFGGATAAAFCITFLNPEGLRLVEPLVINYPKVILAEFLFTFALMWVILNVAIAKGTAGNGFYGIAIGAIVAAGAYAVGTISFAAFNPAVTLALCINGFLPWSALPVYWITQAVAAIAAGLVFSGMEVTSDSELSGKPWN